MVYTFLAFPCPRGLLIPFFFFCTLDFCRTFYGIEGVPKYFIISVRQIKAYLSCMEAYSSSSNLSCGFLKVFFSQSNTDQVQTQILQIMINNRG